MKNKRFEEFTEDFGLDQIAPYLMNPGLFPTSVAELSLMQNDLFIAPQNLLDMGLV